MLKVIKLELKPSKWQKTLIDKTCGCCRLVFNLMLAEKIRIYKERERFFKGRTCPLHAKPLNRVVCAEPNNY